MKDQKILVSKILFCLLFLLPALLLTPSGRSAAAKNFRSTPDQAGRIIPSNSVNVTQQSGNQVCGTISAFTPATNDAVGSITIGGMSFTIVKGASLQGITVGANVCLTLCLDSSGHITGISSISTSNGETPASICGFVTGFNQASTGQKGSITIAGMTFPITEALQLPGQNLAKPGAFLCLSPVISDGALTAGSSLSTSATSLQFSAPNVVNGTTNIYGPPHGEDQFLLPDPTIFTVSSPAPAGTSIFPANTSTFGPFTQLEGTNVQGLMLSTSNSTVRALTCTDSFWDIIFQVATLGNTQGDMVTFFLQNPNGTNPQVVAMFTIENGGMKLTQLHKDVTLFWGPQKRPVGTVFPITIFAGDKGLRTPTLTLAFSMDPTSPLNGCFQLGAEIKRGAGEGSTSLVISYIQVKRMETPSDPVVSIGTGLFSGSLGWFPTGKVCDLICTACVPIPETPNNSLSGFVYCDGNKDGIRQSGESGLAGVKITLTGPVTKETFTDSTGAYSFTGLPAGTYKITENQPAGVMDGADTVGTLGGTLSDDMVADIVLPNNGSGTGYNFAEICMNKCDTICWRTTQFFITFIRSLPGGAILIPGVNANNPVGIQQNLNTVRIALQGGNTPMLKLSKEFVTGQLSLAGAGGQGSPVVFNTFWSPLRCSGVSFGEITLSNGFKFSPNSLLNDLVDQTVLAIKENRSADFEALASIWAMINGRC